MAQAQGRYGAALTATEQQAQSAVQLQHMGLVRQTQMQQGRMQRETAQLQAQQQTQQQQQQQVNNDLQHQLQHFKELSVNLQNELGSQRQQFETSLKQREFQSKIDAESNLAQLQQQHKIEVAQGQQQFQAMYEQTASIQKELVDARAQNEHLRHENQVNVKPFADLQATISSTARTNRDTTAQGIGNQQLLSNQVQALQKKTEELEQLLTAEKDVAAQRLVEIIANKDAEAETTRTSFETEAETKRLENIAKIQFLESTNKELEEEVDDLRKQWEEWNEEDEEQDPGGVKEDKGVPKEKEIHITCSANSNVEQEDRPTTPRTKESPGTGEPPPTPPHSQEYHAKEANFIKLEEWPTCATFRNWKLCLKEKVCAASARPPLAFKWMTEVDTLSYEDIEAADENGFFATLNAKLSVSLTGVMHGEFKRKVQLLNEKASDQGKHVSGRQILWMIYDHLKIADTDNFVLDITDLVSVCLRGDDITALKNDWEHVLSKQQKEICTELFVSLWKQQLVKSVQLKDVVQTYNSDNALNKAPKDYKRLMALFDSYQEFSLLTRNRKQLEQKPGAHYAGDNKGKDKGKKGKGKGKNGKGKTTAKGDCRQMQNFGKCGNQSCPYNHKGLHWHVEDKGQGYGKGKDKGKKGKNDGKGRSASPQSKDGRGTSPSGANNKPLCHHYVAGKCTKGKECTLWHPPVCRNSCKEIAQEGIAGTCMTTNPEHRQRQQLLQHLHLHNQKNKKLRSKQLKLYSKRPRRKQRAVVT